MLTKKPLEIITLSYIDVFRCLSGRQIGLARSKTKRQVDLVLASQLAVRVLIGALLKVLLSLQVYY